MLQIAKGCLEESKQKLEDEKSACETKIHRLHGKLDGKVEDLIRKEVCTADVK